MTKVPKRMWIKLYLINIKTTCIFSEDLLSILCQKETQCPSCGLADALQARRGKPVAVRWLMQTAALPCTQFHHLRVNLGEGRNIGHLLGLT